MNQVRFFLRAFLMLPFFPLMIFQGTRLRKTLHFPAEPSDTSGEYGHDGQKFKVLLIGESSIAGVGASSHADGLAGMFARELAAHYDWQVQWEVVAKSGYTAHKVNTKLLKHIKSEHADLILIGLGANDALGWSSPNKWATDITQILDQLQQRFPSIPILFMNLPPLRFFPALPPLIRSSASHNLHLLGKELEQITYRYEQVWFCGPSDEFKLWSKELKQTADKNQLFSDGIHPSETTYRRWGSLLGRFVINKELIKQSKASS